MNFFSLLTVLLIGLKLCGVITWSWWLVLAPLWGGALLVVLCAVVAILFNVIGN